MPTPAAGEQTRSINRPLGFRCCVTGPHELRSKGGSAWEKKKKDCQWLLLHRTRWRADPGGVRRPGSRVALHGICMYVQVGENHERAQNGYFQAGPLLEER